MPKISYYNLNSDRKLVPEQFCILFYLKITVLVCALHTGYLVILPVFKSFNPVNELDSA